jgi:ABC-type sugar transport system ATPase subunit
MCLQPPTADYGSRNNMHAAVRDEVHAMRERLPATTLHITHHPTQAMIWPIDPCTAVRTVA